MKANFLLNPDKYTLKNALVWGLCRNHLSQAKQQATWQGRTVHRIIGLSEALPIVGQIVSLFELGMNSLFKGKHAPVINQQRPPILPVQIPQPPAVNNPPILPVQIPQLPQPNTLRKDLDLVESFSSLIGYRRFWPHDLSVLGLTLDEAKLLDMQIGEAYRAGHVDYSRKKISYTVGNPPVKVEAQLPITIAFVGERCLLFTKKVFMESGERKIRWVYDLKTGERFLKKRVVGHFEETILNLLVASRHRRGLNCQLIWRNSVSKTGAQKRQMIETLRDGTITCLFNTEPFQDLTTRCKLIVDLLEDLRSLHSLSCSNLTITSENDLTNPIVVAPFGVYHSDLKFDNTLVSKQNDEWRAEICDFGSSAGNPKETTRSFGWTPPEFVRFFSSSQPAQKALDARRKLLDTINLNVRNGQKRDIWSMGLLILSILTGRQNQFKIQVRENNSITNYTSALPPLACLDRHLRAKMGTDRQEDGILDLTQHELHEDIEQLESELLRKHPSDRDMISLFMGVVKNGMLLINPVLRDDVKDLLGRIYDAIPAMKRPEVV